MTAPVFELVRDVVVAGTSGAFGWVFAKLRTRRERKASDLELVNNAIEPLLKSITDLTAHIDEITAKLVGEQEKNVKLLRQITDLLEERDALLQKAESCEIRVSALTDTVRKWEERMAPAGGAAPENTAGRAAAGTEASWRRPETE